MIIEEEKKEELTFTQQVQNTDDLATLASLITQKTDEILAAEHLEQRIAISIELKLIDARIKAVQIAKQRDQENADEAEMLAAAGIQQDDVLSNSADTEFNGSEIQNEIEETLTELSGIVTVERLYGFLD